MPTQLQRVTARMERDAAGYRFIALTFKYDPFFVSQVKTIPASQWMPNPPDPTTGQKTGGRWRVPYTEDLFKIIADRFAGVLSLDSELAELKRKTELLEAKTRDIKLTNDAAIAGFTFSTAPYAHQRAGLSFLTDHPVAALLWEMGTGKTKTVIDDLTFRKERGEPMGGIVFCPNEVKGVWARQVPLHSGDRLSVEIIDGPLGQRAIRLEESDADVKVLNVESLLYLKDVLLKHPWPFIVIDEATRIKSYKAQRTRVALDIKSPLKRILTGTPITNSPVDVWAPFTFLVPAMFGDYWRFRDRYLVMGGYEGKEVVGYLHLDELGQKLQTVSYRLLKEQVLNLPPKTYHDLDVTLDGPTLAAYKSMRDELRVWWTEGSEEKEVKARIALTQLLRLTQIAGGLLQQGEQYKWLSPNPKLSALEGLLDDVLMDPNAKAVIFAVYRKEIEALRDHFTAFNPFVLYGGVAEKTRTAAWQTFQEDSEHRIMIAQMHSGGIGIDLFRAQTAIYYTRNWSLEDYLQSQDRLHRIGQTGTVNIIHLQSKLPDEKVKGAMKRVASIDDVIGRTLRKKMGLANAVLADRMPDDDVIAIVEEVLS